MSAVHSILIAAFGNASAGDDAFGILVAEQLEKRLPPWAELARFEDSSATLVEQLAGRAGLLIVDAVQVKEEAAGKLMDLACDEPAALPIGLDRGVTTHGFGLGWQLRLAGELDLLPRRSRLICCVGEHFLPGTKPQARVLNQVRPAAYRVRWWAEIFAAETQT